MQELRAFSRDAQCYDPLSDDIVGNSTAARNVVPRALVCDPEHCAAVRRIVDDEVLTCIARDYLGYSPNHAEPTLIWSLAVRSIPESVAEETDYHAATYHYDTHGFNSVQVMFYLSEVDRQSGAHAVLRKSHRMKRFSMKLRSSLQVSESELIEHFGPEAELVIEGSAGDGFIEDPACYHRIIHPTNADRLALRIIYS